MIHYQVDVGDLTEIERALGMQKDKSKQVLKAAINDTVKETDKLLANEANKRYYIKKTKVKKTLSKKKATVSKLEGLVISTGGANELYDYKVSPRAYNPRNRPKAGHKGNVNRMNKAKNLYLRPGHKDKYKAFVVKYKSGHISIAQRVPGTKMRDKPNKEGIKNMYSLATPKLLGEEQGVYGIVEPQMYDILEQSIERELQRILR